MNEDQKLWQYSRGVWEQVPSPFTSGTEAEALKAAGYDHLESVGGADEFTCIEIYQHAEQGRYLCCLQPGVNSYFDVLSSDMPSLLMFLKEYAPLVQRQVQSDFLAELRTTISRAFEAWHGHAPHTMCRQCDHVAVEQEALRRQRREQQKRAAQQAA